jgi:hypothetical protein
MPSQPRPRPTNGTGRRSRPRPTTGSSDHRATPVAALESDLFDVSLAHATMDEFATEITASWLSAVTGIIRTGHLLRQAKIQLAHGDWTDMLVQKLPFGPRTAQRLMAIAAHPVLSNPTHVSVLPSSWGTLYELSKLDSDVLERCIASREIDAETERKTAEQLVQRIRREGSMFLWSELRGALATIARFARHWPDADEPAQQVANGYVGDWDSFCEVAAWISKLESAARTHKAESERQWEQDIAEQERRERQERQRQRQRLSGAEQSRRKGTRERMRRRNGMPED